MSDRFQLSLGGFPLLYDQDRQVAEFLGKYQPIDDILSQIDLAIPSQDTRDSSLGESKVGLPHPNYPEPPRPRFNQLYWPTGAARWARGYFLVTQTVAKALEARCGKETLLIAILNGIALEIPLYTLAPRPVSCTNTVPAAGGNAAVQAVGKDTKANDIYYGPSESPPNDGGGGGGGEESGVTKYDDLFIVPVVDHRYWWQFANYGDKGKPTITTWDDLFDHLASKLGIVLTHDAVKAAYLDPDPDEFTRRFDNCATLLDAVAHSVGQRIVRQVDGTVRSIAWENSETESTDNITARVPWFQTAGDTISRTAIPEFVEVAFPRLDCGVPSCNRAFYSKRVASADASDTPSLCTRSGSVKTILSTAWANYAIGASNPSNAAELDALAEAVAVDFCASQKVHYDYTFAGLKSWYFTGYDDHALYSFGTESESATLNVDSESREADGDEGDVESVVTQTYERGYFTRIQSCGHNFGVDQMLHQGSAEARMPEGIVPMQVADDQCLMPGGNAQAYMLKWDDASLKWVADKTCVTIVYDPFERNYILPDEPFWARRSCESGHLEAVGSNGLMRRAKAETTIPCGSSGPVLPYHNQADNYSCFPVASSCGVVACNAWSCTDTIGNGQEIFIHWFERTWQIIPVATNSSSGSGLVRFELLTQLPLGGYATAIQIGTSAPYTRVGNPFPIKDPWALPGMWRYDPYQPVTLSNRGYMGWCVLPADAEVDGYGNPVREIVWMEQIARSIVFRLYEDFGGGNARAQLLSYYLQGKDPIKTTVHIGGGLIRVWDTTGNYPHALKNAIGKARYNDQTHQYEVVECNQMAFFMRGTLLSDMCSGNPAGIINSPQVMTFAQYGQKPPGDVLPAWNVFNLSGKANDDVMIGWDDSLQAFIIVQVDHKLVSVLTSIDKTDCSIVTKKRNVSVVYCSDELDGPSIDFYEIDVPVRYETVSPTSGSDICQIRAYSKRVCASLTDPDEVTEDFDIIADFTSQLVLTNITQKGICIEGEVQLLYVLCASAIEDVPLFCGTTCDSTGS